MVNSRNRSPKRQASRTRKLKASKLAKLLKLGLAVKPVTRKSRSSRSPVRKSRYSSLKSRSPSRKKSRFRASTTKKQRLHKR
jgi:hypothetical protein